ncbi:MAG: hypothetical protein NUV97_03925 [archaeon]|nr:hypothetical protein [archaeon]MCR4323833.1 hypothetical protein [Nanoarchaeota archaeon]
MNNFFFDGKEKFYREIVLQSKKGVLQEIEVRKVIFLVYETLNSLLFNFVYGFGRGGL